MQQQSNNEMVLYQGTGKVIGLSIGALIFVLLGVLFVVGGLSEEKTHYLLVSIGVVSVVLFGLCLAYFVYRLFNRKPSIIVNEEGLLDNSSYIGGGFLRWEEIKDIVLYDFMGQRFIGIQLFDEEQFVNRQSAFKKGLMRLNSGMVQAPINIAQSGLKMPLDQLYGLIYKQWRRSTKQEELSV